MLNYIVLEDIVKLAKLKFPEYKLERSIGIIKGCLYSSKIQIKL